jgi:hypothetical protein
MFHKGISLLGAGVLAASVIAVPMTASAATSAVTTTIAGHIEGSDGAVFGSGTPVVVWATPSQDELAAAKVGDSFVNTPIASGVLGTGGAFSLPIDDVAGLSKYASKDGLLNLEVRATEGTDVAPFALSRKIVTVGGTTALVDPSDLSNSQATVATAAQVAAANKPATITAQAAPKSIAQKSARAMAVAAGEPGTEPTVEPQDPSMDPTDGSGGGALDPSQEAPDYDVAPPGGSVGPNQPSTQTCGEDYKGDLGSKKVIVGSSYANAKNTTGTFTYQSGSSSSIGVGYSATGAAGSWKQSGTYSRSSTSAISFGSRTGGVTYATYFKFGKYAAYCYPVGGRKTEDSYYSWKVRPSSYVGGAAMNASTTPSATKCSNFSGGGTTLTRDSSKANTWSSGASLDSSIGINLSSETGFSSAAKLSYKNTGSAARQICGTNDYWGGSPRRAVTK